MGNGFVEAMRAPDATSWWILLPSPSALPSAAPIPGSMWNSLARASWNGFKPSWNCPGGSLPMTPSAMSLPVWTQPNSRTAWCPGPRPSRNCCPVRWSPLTARRPDGPMTGRGAMHMLSAWATQNTPVSSTGQALTLGQVKTEAKSNEITAIP